MKKSTIVATAAACVWLGWGREIASHPAPQAPPQASFRSGVDIIAVDVAVLARDGRPVADLPPASFDVTIDGRRRVVSSAQFVRYLPESTLAGGTRTTNHPTATNLWPSDVPGRSFVLAIDTASFSSGESANVTRAARRFVDRLSASDLIGVYTLPHGTALPPTTDREAVRHALTSVVGGRSVGWGQFHMTPAEIIDIAAADGIMQTPAPTVGRGAATPVPVVVNDTLRAVQLRECRTTNDSSCTAGIVSEADGFSRQFEGEAEAALLSLQRMLATLAEYPARRTVVILSAGMPISDRQGSWNSDGSLAVQVGHTAARANATVYSLHVDVDAATAYSAEGRRPRQNQARERDLQQLLLGQISATSGGALLSAPTGSSEVALDRLLTETSAYYLLGVAPDARDFDGRAHTLKVKVAERGAVVRSRQFVWLPKKPRLPYPL